MMQGTDKNGLWVPGTALSVLSTARKLGWDMSFELLCGGALVLGGVAVGIAFAQIWQNKTVRAVAALVVLVGGGWFIANHYEQIVQAWEQINHLVGFLGGLR